MALENIKTPTMRLVQGSCFVRQDKDLAGKPFKKDDGTIYTKGFIALAGKKGDPEIEAFRKQIMDQGPIECPQYFPNGVSNRPNFSYKIVDGDGVDQNGQPNSGKDGFAGHWVFRMSTQFPIKAFPTGKYEIADQLVMAPGGVEPFGRGNYVRAIITVKSNGDTNKPGLAVYPSHVEFMRQGEPIINGPSAASLFGDGPARSAGASNYTMTAAANGLTREQYHASGWQDAQLIAAGMMTVTTPAPAAAAPPPVAAAPAAPPPAQAVAPAAPLPPGGSAPAPQAPAPTAVVAAAPGYKMADASGPAYAAYIAQGWTDAALVQNQIMVPV